jgi:hypothetical protein
LGAGIYNDGTLYLDNATVTENIIVNGVGGGVYNGGTANVRNSIVANQVTGVDCNTALGNAGFNTDSDGTCGFGGAGATLAPCGDDGGLTLICPVIGSPPQDLGSCVDQFNNPVLYDQNFGLRSAPCDMGAHELGAPTLVDLASFTAAAGEDGVQVAWSTASEIDNAGFNVWRAESADGAYVKLNSALIPAQGGPTQGASYSFLDAATFGGYYKLEDVDTGGVSTFHGPVGTTGPVSAEGGAPTSVGLLSFAASALTSNVPVALLVIPLLALSGGGLVLLRRKRRL